MNSCQKGSSRIGTIRLGWKKLTEQILRWALAADAEAKMASFRKETVAHSLDKIYEAFSHYKSMGEKK